MGGNSRLIDDHHHALLAVVALGAVQPQRVGVVDLDGVGRDHAHRGARRHGQEARVEARDVAVHADGLARLVEGGLCDGVVAGVELELHKLARLGGQPVGGVGQATILGDRDDPRLLGWCLSVSCPPHLTRAGTLLTGCQARESGEDECCELHFEDDVCVYRKSEARVGLVERVTEGIEKRLALCMQQTKTGLAWVEDYEETTASKGREKGIRKAGNPELMTMDSGKGKRRPGLKIRTRHEL